MVTTDYVFHFEDDWEFLTQDRLLYKCWTVMQASPEIGIACLRGFNFGARPTSDDSVTYGIHAYNPPSSPWPGFSLNPGLFDLRRIRATGEFRDVPNFELDYARRYHSCGHRLAHVNPPSNGSWIRHIGSTTAYNLNHTTR